MVSKVVDLQQAIRQWVRPGMEIYIANGARASIRALVKEYWQQRPDFTLVMMRVGGGHGGDLIHTGIVKKVVAASFVDVANPGPMPPVQRAYKGKTVEFEHWSDFTFVQRLLAGALGLPFAPTHGLLGTTMAERNVDSFRLMQDPFGSGDEVGLARALNPNIAFVHASAADEYGNAIFIPPFPDDNLWGAKASDGVIVTTERILSEEELRNSAHLVRLPGYMVRAVCLVPFGAHPGNLENLDLDGFDAYAEDHEFLKAYAEATGDVSDHDAWIREWVLDCEDHAAYLEKLGRARLDHLFAEARIVQPQGVLPTTLPATSDDYTDVEFMAIVAARELVELCTLHGLSTVLVGFGPGAVACSLAKELLRQQGHRVDLLAGTSGFGQIRGAVPPSFIMRYDSLESYGVVVGGHQGRTAGVLGAGQIDPEGNINTSELSEDSFLTGSGGGSDTGTLSTDVIVVTRQSRRRFVPRVNYITTAGKRIRSVVTDQGLFKKDENGRLTLTALAPLRGSTRGEAFARMKETCSWEFAPSEVVELPPPTAQELALLRILAQQESKRAGG